MDLLLRRMLLDSEGRPRQLLLNGQRKCIANERVTLVPGPAEEIAIVRRVFREFVEERRSLRSIATRLNNDGIPFIAGGRWAPTTVTNLLKHPNYIGSLDRGAVHSEVTGWIRVKGFLNVGLGLVVLQLDFF